MLSRRDVLIGAALSGAAMVVRPLSRMLAVASQPRTPVNFKVPAGACDCHTHIFDPQHFSYAASRTYTPEPATVEEMQRLHRTLHIDRVVIVQPSVYGADNSCTLNALKQTGASARGVAVIDEKTPEAALDEMDRAGVRGIRINLETGGQSDATAARQRFQAAVERIKNRKWHIQIYARQALIEAIKDQVTVAPMPVVFDHFGGAQASLGIEQPGFEALLDLVQKGKAYVKISGAYRSSTQSPDYSDVTPLARALITANIHRILWGSDWPHPDTSKPPGRKATDIFPFLQIDDGHMLNLFAAWVPDAAQRKTILVDNPAKLYGF